MENIMRRLVANANKQGAVVVPKTSTGLTSEVRPFFAPPEPVDNKVLQNQAYFRTIFGEEPPSWWGNFSPVLN